MSARLTSLFHQHYRATWRLLRRLGLTSAEADDAAQEVFVIVARKLGSIAPESERAFVLATAQRLAANVRRSRQPLEPMEQVTHLAGASVEPDDAELTRWLDEALNGLDEATRDAVVLCELEGCTRDEAAQVLGIPPGTVASRLRRGVAQLEASAARYAATIEREQRGRST